jgi:hypothetical protein
MENSFETEYRLKDILRARFTPVIPDTQEAEEDWEDRCSLENG